MDDPGDKSYVKGYAVTSGTLFAIAANAYDESVAKGDDGTHPMRPFTAVIFAVTALEAFVNELVQHAAVFRMPEDKRAARRLVGLMRETDLEDQSNLRLKYTLAMIAITGDAYCEGAQPYQDFGRLVRLRNELVHSRPRSRIALTENGARFEHPERITKLAQGLYDAGVVCRPELDDTGDWPLSLLSPATEAWACRTAVCMVESIEEAIAPGSLRTIVEVTVAGFRRRLRGAGD